MVSRFGVALLLALVVGAVGAVPGSSGATSADKPVYVVRPDPRLCPSPLCGGYWVALANGARTRCADGRRRPQCYVASAVDLARRPLEVALPEGALARAVLGSSQHDGIGPLGVLRVASVYAPAGEAAVSGGYYRVADTGVRCIRAPCFSYRVTQVNGATRTTASEVDLAAARATPRELARARAALATKGGLLARGRFARTSDGGRVFRALRLYLRAS